MVRVLDWRIKEAADYYVNEVFGIDTATDPHIDGVFVDSGFSIAGGVLNFTYASRRQLQLAELAVFKRTVTMMAAHQKVVTVSLKTHFSSINDQQGARLCAEGMSPGNTTPCLPFGEEKVFDILGGMGFIPHRQFNIPSRDFGDHAHGGSGAVGCVNAVLNLQKEARLGPTLITNNDGGMYSGRSSKSGDVNGCSGRGLCLRVLVRVCCTSFVCACVPYACACCVRMFCAGLCATRLYVLCALICVCMCVSRLACEKSDFPSSFCSSPLGLVASSSIRTLLAVLSLPHTPPPQPALSYFLHFQNSIGLRTVDTFLPHLRAALPGLVNAEPTFDRSHIPPRQDVLQRQKTLMQQSREVPTAESALNPPQPTVSSPGSVT